MIAGQKGVGENVIPHGVSGKAEVVMVDTCEHGALAHTQKTAGCL